MFGLIFVNFDLSSAFIKDNIEKNYGKYFFAISTFAGFYFSYKSKKPNFIWKYFNKDKEKKVYLDKKYLNLNFKEQGISSYSTLVKDIKDITEKFSL
jgi:hypothetical protein